MSASHGERSFPSGKWPQWSCASASLSSKRSTCARPHRAGVAGPVPDAGEEDGREPEGVGEPEISHVAGRSGGPPIVTGPDWESRHGRAGRGPRRGPALLSAAKHRAGTPPVLPPLWDHPEKVPARPTHTRNTHRPSCSAFAAPPLGGAVYAVDLRKPEPRGGSKRLFEPQEASRFFVRAKRLYWARDALRCRATASEGRLSLACGGG